MCEKTVTNLFSVYSTSVNASCMKPLLPTMTASQHIIKRRFPSLLLSDNLADRLIAAASDPSACRAAAWSCSFSAFQIVRHN